VGVKRIYGYPGDGINGIMGAFGRGGDAVPEFIQVRHEEMAAFMPETGVIDSDHRA
jgi:pyruvate dehydrogenase (quinone)